jgi:hypothetical protein
MIAVFESVGWSFHLALISHIAAAVQEEVEVKVVLWLEWPNLMAWVGVLEGWMSSV